MPKKMRVLSLLMRSGEFLRSADADQAVRQGRVTVGGKAVTNPAHSVKMSLELKLDGRVLKPMQPVYMIMNKKAGLVCQKSAGEKTVYDVIGSIKEIDPRTRNTLFCVGRLDRDTEGLLVVTNDGQVEKLLTKKESHVVKTYEAVVEKPVSEADLEKLRHGVSIKDDDSEKTFLVKASSARRLDNNTLEICIDEGRKRQVKKMVEAIGNKTISLRRTGVGSLMLKDVDFGGKDYLIVKKSELKLPGMK
jgi:pseudouridine synthase